MYDNHISYFYMQPLSASCNISRKWHIIAAHTYIRKP